MIKYIVEIGYKEFEFDNMMEAATFADIGYHHIVDDTYKCDVIIRIKEVKEDPTPQEKPEAAKTTAKKQSKKPKVVATSKESILS